jgi:serine/alanine adding enzyme
MVQVIEQPDAALLSELQTYLANAGPTSGVCAEHDPRWLSVLRQGLDHRTFALIARGDGRHDATGPIRGYLPLALVSGRLFGRFLVSLPYLNRAGIVAEDDAVRTALSERATELARVHDVKYLELRHEDAAVHDSLGRQRADKVRMVLELPADADSLWDQLHSKVRNQVRKGDRSGLTVRWGGTALLNDFYAVFAENMRDLGTPVYSRRLFAQILDTLDGDAELAVVNDQHHPVAGALLIHSHQCSQPSPQVPSASCLRRFNHTNANMWMYHRLLVRAIERGSKAFDFGRSSTDSGTYRFKKQWGAVPFPTVWQYHLRHGDIDAVRPQSRRFQRRIEMWQKLPVWLSRLLGPPIVRGIP